MEHFARKSYKKMGLRMLTFLWYSRNAFMQIYFKYFINVLISACNSTLLIFLKLKTNNSCNV